MRNNNEVIQLTPEMRQLLTNCVRLSGLHQKKLAELAGVQQSWMSRMMRGDRYRLEPELVKKTVEALAAKLETMGVHASRQAEYLRQVFLGDVLVNRPMSAIRKMAIIGLTRSGLGIDEVKAGEMIDTDPCLKAKICGAIKVFQAVEAIIGAIPESIKDPTLGEMITAGIESCGLEIEHEIAMQFCTSGAMQKITKVISALNGVAAIVEIAKRE